MKDLRQAPAWAKYLKSIGWEVERINGSYYYLKKLPLLGYLLKAQRTQKIDLKAIEKLTKKYKIYKTIIEPLNNFVNSNYRLSKSSYLPTKTIQIDLTKTQEKILSQMHPKTRYNIKIAKRNNIDLTDSKSIGEFVNFWRRNFEKKKFLFLSQKKNIIALYKAFKKNANILIASKNSEIVATLLLLRTRNTIYYMYAASNAEGRKLFAPTLLTWEAILLGKKYHCKIFDFDGIYDERFPLNSWKGFTKFKKGFGGYEVEYPGCFIKTSSIIKL